MQSLLVLAGFVIIAATAAACLGHLLDGGFGAGVLAVITTLAPGLCVAAFLLSKKWWTAVVAVLLVERVGTWISKQIFKPSGVKLVRWLWFIYAATGALIYVNGDWLGLLGIGLPPLALFLAGLTFFAGYVLPIQNPDQRLRTVRSLITVSLGSNFPCYIFRDWKKKERPEPVVEGNTYAKFFAGPGVVLTSCDHLVVTSTRLEQNMVKPPGLAFTGSYERIQAVVDLRPQLRVFTVQAETQDGIPVEVFTFWPTQIDSGRRKPGLRKSLPFLKDAVFRAVYRQHHEHEWERDRKGKVNEEIRRLDWDDLLAQTIGPPIVKEIILDYTCDQLCSPGDPREAIKQEIKQQLSEAMRPYGVRVVGGGISNIVPPEDVIQQRIRNWQAHWQKEVAAELGKLEAGKARYSLDMVRAQVQVGLLRRIADKLSRILKNETMSERFLALCITESIQEMLEQNPIPKEFPPGAMELLSLYRRRLGS